MPLVPTARLVADAAAAGQGLAAFNVITIEHAEAIVAGAERAGLPVILQLSQNAVKFHGWRLGPIAAATAAVAAAASVGVALHLDHVERQDLLHEARRVLGPTQRERWIASTLAGLGEVAAQRGHAERAE